jgi:hypothetical protein
MPTRESFARVDSCWLIAPFSSDCVVADTALPASPHIERRLERSIPKIGLCICYGCPNPQAYPARVRLKKDLEDDGRIEHHTGRSVGMTLSEYDLMW